MQLVSVGAEEVLQGGIYGYCERHLAGMDRERTWFLNVETVGGPSLALLEGEGCVVMEDYFDRPWRDLIGRVAERDGLPLRRGMRARTSTDSVSSSRMGVPTATLIAINRYKALSNYHRMTDTPENICCADRRLCRRPGRRPRPRAWRRASSADGRLAVAMWGDKRVSVVLMTYAERDSIREVIEGFEATGVVDEVLVVNNNAERGTSEEVARTPAREVFETEQGYGNASRRGLREASGDLIVLAEPDGTFLPDRHPQAARLQRRVRGRLRHPDHPRADLGRSQHGVVPALGQLGRREVVEVLFNTSHLSDVGCTYRLFTARSPSWSPSGWRSAATTPAPR